MGHIKNAFDYNNIMATRNRRLGEMEYTLMLRKGKAVGSITLTENQFKELVEQLELTEELSLTHKENKVYIIGN